MSPILKKLVNKFSTICTTVSSKTCMQIRRVWEGQWSKQYYVFRFEQIVVKSEFLYTLVKLHRLDVAFFHCYRSLENINGILCARPPFSPQSIFMMRHFLVSKSVSQCRRRSRITNPPQLTTTICHGHSLISSDIFEYC